MARDTPQLTHVYEIYTSAQNYNKLQYNILQQPVSHGAGQVTKNFKFLLSKTYLFLGHF